MKIFDSHAHYDDPAFDADREELLASFPSRGIVGVCNMGTTLETSRKAAELAEKYPFIHAAAGIHPEEAENARPDDMERIGELIQSHPKTVAVGEIGLDYHCDVDRAVQMRLFEEQLVLARELDLPVSIHDRDAHADTLRLIRQYRPKGVVHCYSGSAEMARKLLECGMYLGFTGVVTFRNNKKAPAVLAVVPHDRILVETDCPYMAPEPLRGHRCDSTMLVHTITRVAEYLGLEPETAAALTAENARTLFGISKPSAATERTESL